MKKMYFLLISLITVSAAQAQTANAVVFSENGEKFTLFLNGEKQNDSPMSNVKMKGLTGEFYQARVDFEDAKLADFSNNNFAVQKGVEVTYMIKVNKKGEFVMRYASQAEISSTASSGSTNTTAAESEAKRIADVDDAAVEEKIDDTHATIEVAGDVDDEQVVQTTTTTTTSKPTGKSGEKVAVGMNIGGVNMGVNIEVSEDGESMDMDTDVKETTVTKTTTTTTKTGVSTTASKPAVKETPVQPKEDVVIVTSTSGCAKSMTASSFATAKQNVEDKGFDETRLSTAKTIIKANCMTSAQIKEMCDVFGFEETKLAFAKYAYDYCTDQESYYLVNETFGFSSNTDELNKYIESK
ncbi:MAG: DUF4476 domain-containing protein [Flavobacteriales bacterium]